MPTLSQRLRDIAGLLVTHGWPHHAVHANQAADLIDAAVDEGSVSPAQALAADVTAPPTPPAAAAPEPTPIPLSPAETAEEGKAK